jgi:hypothetical protein
VHRGRTPSLLPTSTNPEYTPRNRPPSRRDREDAMLTEKIREIHDRSRGIYGAPRIHAALRDKGIRIGKKQVARLMKAAGLRGVSRRKRPSTTIQEEGARPAPDLVERDFSAEEPDQLWVADWSEPSTMDVYSLSTSTRSQTIMNSTVSRSTRVSKGDHCCRPRPECRGRSSLHLGNISLRTGRALTCDPANGHIEGDDEAMRLWSRTYASGWAPTV